MAKKLNGNLWIWKAIGWITGILVLAAGVVSAFAVMRMEVCEMKPEVKLNTEHRLKDDLNQTYMDKRFDRIEDGLKEFTVEQRAVNKEILDKLEER